MFAEAQRLGIPILTANVGRKGRRDPLGLYLLALERTSHYGVIGIFRPGPTQWLSDQQIIAALNRLAQLEQAELLVWDIRVVRSSNLVLGSGMLLEYT